MGDQEKEQKVVESLIFQHRSWAKGTGWKIKCRIPETDPYLQFPLITGPHGVGQPMKMTPELTVFPIPSKK